MASYNYGKDEVMARVLRYLKAHRFYDLVRILDVGACDGKWSMLLAQTILEGIRDDEDDLPIIKVDGVEIFKPNAAKILDLYDDFFVGDISHYWYRHQYYDIVILGDVIEHMEVAAAQFVIDYACSNAKADVIVGVPYQYKQGPIYGNPWERHVQDDLTPELMARRYPRLELMFEAAPNYAYYHKIGGAL